MYASRFYSIRFIGMLVRLGDLRLSRCIHVFWCGRERKSDLSRG